MKSSQIGSLLRELADIRWEPSPCVLCALRGVGCREIYLAMLRRKDREGVRGNPNGDVNRHSWYMSHMVLASLVAGGNIKSPPYQRLVIILAQALQ